MFARSRVLVAVTALAAAGAMTLTGCSSSGGTEAGGGSGSTGAAAPAPPTSAAPPAVTSAAAPAPSAAATTAGGGGQSPADLVPAAIKSKGTLHIASDASYPPMEFFKPGTKSPIIGADADLAAALGKVLNLKIDMTNATFDSIIPGLVDGKYDLGMSSFTDTKKREKKVDFVSYFKAGESFYKKADNPKDYDGIEALCGVTVAVENGTTEQTDAKAQSGKCTAAGKKPVKVLQFKDQSGANLAVANGRAQLGFADSPPVAYIVQQSNGKFAQTGKPFGLAPYGIAVPKGSGLAKAMQAAVQELIDNGTYAKILTKWELSSGAITTSQINIAKS